MKSWRGLRSMLGIRVIKLISGKHVQLKEDKYECNVTTVAMLTNPAETWTRRAMLKRFYFFVDLI